LAKSENFAASFRFRSALVNWSVIYGPMQPRAGQRPHSPQVSEVRISGGRDAAVSVNFCGCCVQDTVVYSGGPDRLTPTLRATQPVGRKLIVGVE